MFCILKFYLSISKICDMIKFEPLDWFLNKCHIYDFE